MKTFTIAILFLTSACCQGSLSAEQVAPLLDAKYQSGYVSPAPYACGGYFITPGCLDCLPRYYRQAAPQTSLSSGCQWHGLSWYLGAQQQSSNHNRAHCDLPPADR